jgi:hypothetical protein
MGGGQVSKQSDTVVPSPHVDRNNTIRFSYSVQIVNPNTATAISCIVKDEYDEMPLARLMNKLCFASSHANELKTNFVSVYNKQTDEFEYYIESMLSYSPKLDSLPVSGSQWYVYINNVKTSWNQVCGSDTRVSTYDKVVFTYE